jgi:hypothetical protein
MPPRELREGVYINTIMEKKKRTIWREILVCFFISLAVGAALYAIPLFLQNVTKVELGQEDSGYTLLVLMSIVVAPCLAMVLTAFSLEKRQRIRNRLGAYLVLLTVGLVISVKAAQVARTANLLDGAVGFSNLQTGLIILAVPTVLLPFCLLLRYEKKAVITYLIQGSINLFLDMLFVLFYLISREISNSASRSFIFWFQGDRPWSLSTVHLLDIVNSSIGVFGLAVCVALFWGLMRFTEEKFTHSLSS